MPCGLPLLVLSPVLNPYTTTLYAFLTHVALVHCGKCLVKLTSAEMHTCVWMLNEAQLYYNMACLVRHSLPSCAKRDNKEHPNSYGDQEKTSKKDFITEDLLSGIKLRCGTCQEASTPYEILCLQIPYNLNFWRITSIQIITQKK